MSDGSTRPRKLMPRLPSDAACLLTATTYDCECRVRKALFQLFKGGNRVVDAVVILEVADGEESWS